MTTTPSPLSGKTVVLIGGGTGIGLRVAQLAVDAGAQVVLGGRTASKLEAAAAQLGEAAHWFTVDTSDDDSVKEFFTNIPSVDALFTTAADYQVGSFREQSVEEAASPFTSKFWGQYRVVHAALDKLTPTASVVLMSGAASVRPPAAAAAYVAANAAIEGLGRGLAVELSPIRVNTVAPGTIDGHLWAQRPAEVREAAFTWSAEKQRARPRRERRRDCTSGVLSLHQHVHNGFHAVPRRRVRVALDPCHLATV